MKITKPAYFDTFRCLASGCPDSCCKEWSVAVDEDTADYYRELPGPLGDKLRSVLAEEDGITVMTIENGRCPMWRQDGLCRIQAELGEQGLCDTCRNFPRISHDFGDFVELQLELSCPEAARLILQNPDAPTVTYQVPGGDEPEYDPEEMETMLALRRELLQILRDPALTPNEAISAIYRRGSGIALPAHHAGDLESIKAFFLNLETLSPSWPQRLQDASVQPLHPMVRGMARYLLERYWLQYTAEGLTDTLGKITFVAVSCILVSALGGDFMEAAQAYSKEIENSDCNPQSIMDAAYQTDALSPGNILALLNS